MQAVGRALAGVILVGIAAFAQNTFVVTGTAIPADLLQQNYGRMPKGIGAYDLSICNVTDGKQSIVSSQIYQALAQSNSALQPVGRQIMLAAILRNRNRSAATIFSVALNSVSGVLAVLSSSRYKVPAGLITGAALAAISGQQLMSTLKPILSADQLEKFESEVLEPALVLDSGSCVERTVFTSVPKSAARAQSLNFHVR
jgi:hypothetical protein